MEIFIVLEEDSIGARASKVYTTKEKCEEYIKESFPELRYLTEDAWRSGGVVVSIQKATIDAQ